MSSCPTVCCVHMSGISIHHTLHVFPYITHCTACFGSTLVTTMPLAATMPLISHHQDNHPAGSALPLWGPFHACFYVLKSGVPSSFSFWEPALLPCPSVYELQHSTHSGTAPQSDNVLLMSYQIACWRLPVS